MSTGLCLVNSAPVLPTTEQEQADNTCSGPGERARSHRLGVQPRGEHLLAPKALALAQHGGKPGRTIVCADLSAYPCTSPLSNQCRKGQPLLPVHAGNADHPAPGLVTQHHHLNHSASTSCSGVCSPGYPADCHCFLLRYHMVRFCGGGEGWEGRTFKLMARYCKCPGSRGRSSWHKIKWQPLCWLLLSGRAQS